MEEPREARFHRAINRRRSRDDQRKMQVARHRVRPWAAETSARGPGASATEVWRIWAPISGVGVYGKGEVEEIGGRRGEAVVATLHEGRMDGLSGFEEDDPMVLEE